MKRLLLYPMQYDYAPLLRFPHMTHFQVGSAVAPPGWGMDGKDARVVDNGSLTGLMVTSDYEISLAECDAVLLDDDGLDQPSMLLKIEMAKKMGKEIYCTQKLAKKFSIRNENILGYPELTHPCASRQIHRVSVPIIMVLGLGEQCDKFGLQILLRDHFVKQGYKVSQLGSSIYSSLFGFSALCDVFSLPYEEKIYALNYHVAALAERETPDIMILGVPGGVMPLNEYNGFHFGEMALAMSHAATPDVSVLSIYHTAATAEYINFCKQYCHFRLGMETDYFHMSNTMVHLDQNDETGYDLIKLQPNEFAPVYEELNKESVKIFNINHNESRSFFLHSVTQELQDFPDII